MRFQSSFFWLGSQLMWSCLSHHSNISLSLTSIMCCIFVFYRLGMQGGDSNNIALLQSMGSPLSANTHRLNPDDPFPQPEPGTCPWPSYNCPSNSPYRTFDGSCNNIRNPLYGRAFTPSSRFLPPQYGDSK